MTSAVGEFPVQNLEQVGARTAPFVYDGPIEPRLASLEVVSFRDIKPNDQWDRSRYDGSCPRIDDASTWLEPYILYADTADLIKMGLGSSGMVGAVARFDRDKGRAYVGYTLDTPLLRDMNEEVMGVIYRPNRPEMTVVLGVLSIGRHKEFYPVKTENNCRIGGKLVDDWPWLRRIRYLR